MKPRRVECCARRPNLPARPSAPKLAPARYAVAVGVFRVRSAEQLGLGNRRDQAQPVDGGRPDVGCFGGVFVDQLGLHAQRPGALGHDLLSKVASVVGQRRAPLRRVEAGGLDHRLGAVAAAGGKVVAGAAPVPG